jgi:hypothetical protein
MKDYSYRDKNKKVYYVGKIHQHIIAQCVLRKGKFEMIASFRLKKWNFKEA